MQSDTDCIGTYTHCVSLPLRVRTINLQATAKKEKKKKKNRQDDDKKGANSPLAAADICTSRAAEGEVTCRISFQLTTIRFLLDNSNTMSVLSLIHI